MSQSLWRIATDTKDYEADDLSGAGAKITGGRWNAQGVAVTYTSRHRSLACLETMVHLNAGGLPLNRYLVKVDVPDDIWACAEVLTSETAPVGWDAQPAGRASIAFGSNWLSECRSALLRVPSVIVPEESNVLINPSHPDTLRLTAHKIRKWLYDPRMEK